MSKIVLCGRKRKMTKQQAKAQQTARLYADPLRRVKIYECDKCGTYHTTTNYTTGVSKRAWSRI